MRFLTVIAAAALGLVVACDRGPERRADTAQPPASASGGASATANTPANAGAPRSVDEKKESANPVQGQVDPKQGAQHKDFQHRGDGAGPKSPDPAAKPGS